MPTQLDINHELERPLHIDGFNRLITFETLYNIFLYLFETGADDACSDTFSDTFSESLPLSSSIILVISFSISLLLLLLLVDTLLYISFISE